MSLDGAERELISAMGDDDDEDDIVLDIEDDKSAIECIEDLVLEFLSQLTPENGSPGDDSECELETSTSEINCGNNEGFTARIELADRTKINDDGSFGSKALTYPKKAKSGSIKPFARLFRILDLAHEAIIDDVPATKRDVFYKDPELFGCQRNVDQLVDDIAASFKMERSDLNVKASSKGLICGSALTIYLTSNECIQASDTEPSLIPVGESIESFALAKDVSWVLIVEKDAIFQTLCHLRLCSHPSMSGNGIMVTGKGYADIATRHFVKTLADNLPDNIPFLGLVDGDPFGLDILSTYKYGSRAMAHESDKLATPRLEWLGVYSSELSSFGINTSEFIPITEKDKRKAEKILERPENVLPDQWRDELRHMLHTKRKAEIEILSSIQNRIRPLPGNGDSTLCHDSSSSNATPHDLCYACMSPPASGTDNILQQPHELTHPLLYYLVMKINRAVVSMNSFAL